MTDKAFVPFFDLRAGFRVEQSALEEVAKRVLNSGIWIGGPEVEEFERAWATWVKASHAVGVANGTDAITLALWAVGIVPGDEVILPALSAYPSAVGVMRSGATPVFVDVKEADGLIDPVRVEAAMTPRTKAILPVHLYGNPCDMKALSAIAEKHDAAIVEDCAQAHGVECGGKPVGSWSGAAAWSFYPTKNLGAAGDAGAVTTNKLEVASKLKSLRNYGQRDRYYHDEQGVNSRLDPIQAAILTVRLLKLEARNERRRQIGGRYDVALQGQGALRPVNIGQADRGNRHLYPVFLKDATEREAIRARLLEQGIETLVHYPVAMPDQMATPEAQRQGDFGVARKLAAAEISLPVYPELSDQQVEKVIRALQGLR